MINKVLSKRGHGSIGKVLLTWSGSFRQGFLGGVRKIKMNKLHKVRRENGADLVKQPEWEHR